MSNKVKLEGEIDPSLLDPMFADITQSVDIDANIDPALMNDVSMHGYDQQMTDQGYQAADPHIPFDYSIQDDTRMEGEHTEKTLFEETQFSAIDTKNSIDDLIDPNLEIAHVVQNRVPEPKSISSNKHDQDPRSFGSGMNWQEACTRQPDLE